MRIDSVVNQIGCFFCHGIISLFRLNMFFRRGLINDRFVCQYSSFVSSKMGETYSVILTFN
jgi:hypothetical protein